MISLLFCRGAVAYVGSCYTAVCVALVILLFIQQLILISQNITIQEFNQAIKDKAGQSRPWWSSFYVSRNPYNTGFKANWTRFIRRTRHELPANRMLDSLE